MAAILDFRLALFKRKSESTLSSDHSCEGLVKSVSAIPEKKIQRSPKLETSAQVDMAIAPNEQI